jgi:hypothetical protein
LDEEQAAVASQGGEMNTTAERALDRSQRIQARHLERAKELQLARLLGETPQKQGELGVFATAERILNHPERFPTGPRDIEMLVACIIRAPVAHDWFYTLARKAAQEIQDGPTGQLDLERIVSDLEDDAADEGFPTS